MPEGARQSGLPVVSANRAAAKWSKKAITGHFLWAFSPPGTTIGTYAVAGARTIVTKDVAPHLIVGGNPAKEIGRRDLQQD